ncbi:MAG: DUF3800 domain-containing protein [Elusimicrobiota bacterium]
MWYLYLDESGDLGFDFVNNKPSRYFTITVMALRTVETNRQMSKAVALTVRRKFKNNHSIELKGASCPMNIKKYFFEKVKGIKFALYSITLNKKRVYLELTKDKERVYNYVTRLVLDKIPFEKADFRVEFILDKSKTRKNIKKFNEYIIGQLKGRLNPKVPLDIYHYNSKDNLCIQAVDMFSWGIFRNYERNDREWREVFSEKIAYDEQYL